MIHIFISGWRRSHRPSIRDISIIDEEEFAERDAEADTQDTPTSQESSQVPQAFSTPGPITVQPNSRS